MRKINKKSASLVALQLSTTLSPLTVLTQASADTVSDTVTKAKQSGVDVKVEDNGVIKVSSQQEADAKNAEAEVQLKADALKASQVIDEYIAEKSEVQKANQDAQTRYEAEVKSETERVATLEAEKAKVDAQNAEAQKAYEAEKAQVDAQNAEAQKAYEAEKAKVDAQNAEAKKAYEAEKAKVDAQNAEKVRTYEAELAATKAENAKMLAQYEAELKKAKEANDNKKSVDEEIARIKVENENLQKEYEAELARVTAERDALTKKYEAEKARIEKENATAASTTEAEAAKIEADYQAALETYNQKVNDITAQNQKAQEDYEARKQAIEAKNAKIDADYAVAKKAYDAKLAEVTESNRVKQEAYDKALADYNAGKLDTVTNKEKTLTMELTNVPSDVTVHPKRTIEKDLTNSTNLEADMKAAEDEFKSEEANVNAKLHEYAKAPAEEPVAPNVRALVNKELKAAQDWAAEQNKLGQSLGIRYVIKERLVRGEDATADALTSAYNKVKAQMDNDALVSQHFDSRTRPGGYDWIGSKNRFIQAWADIKQTYETAYSKDDAKIAASRNQPLKVVDYDLTQLDGYDAASKTTATGSVNGTDNVPPEVKAWKDASTAKRKEFGWSATAEADSGSTKVESVDAATYKAKVDEYNKNVLPQIRASVDAVNAKRRKQADMLLSGDLNMTLGSSNSGKRIINDNNMTFTKSSDRVKYLRSQNFTELNDAMQKGFDIANTANSESTTPVENHLAKVKFTAVRIPKGESVTVEYTRKDGKDYLPTGGSKRDTMFVSDSDYNKKDTFTSADEKPLSKIRYTVRNDGSISSTGDIIAFFANDTAIPAYFGISNMGSPEGSNRFTLISDPRQLYGVTTTTEFLGSGNEPLRPTVKQWSVNYPDQNDPSTLRVGYDENRIVKGEHPAVNSAPVKELVSRPDDNGDIRDHGVHFGNRYVPVEKLNDLANNWKDIESWASNQTGWDGTKLVNHLKTYNKDNVDKAVDPTPGRYQISRVETGYYNTVRYEGMVEPARPKFPYRLDGAYTSVRPTGEHVHTIEVPVVRGDVASPGLREVTPVEMVIKYKAVEKGTEPTRPTLEKEPVAPTEADKEPLPTPPTPTPLPEKPVKGSVTPATTKPLPSEPKLPELPQKPTPKVVPNDGPGVNEPNKPVLKQEPVKPTQIPEPKKPEVLVTPVEPKLKETPKPPVVKSVTKVERRVIEKPTLKDGPKAPNITLNKVRYVYEPKTIWETVDGKVLRSWEDGDKPKDTFNGYEYVRTDKDKDGNIHHVYKPTEKPQEQPKMKTIWETVDGEVLRSWEDGDKPKDNFDGYEYVRTDKDNDGNIHHIYKPTEKPQEQPKMKTIWETVGGKVLRSWEDGEKPKDNFDGYEYVRTDKDNDGNIHHIYKPIEKPKVTPKETPKELPKTGGDSGMLSNMLGGIFAMGGLLGFKRRKDKNK